MKLDKTKYEEDIMDQRKEEEERLLIVMVNPVNFPFPWAAFIFILNFRKRGHLSHLIACRTQQFFFLAREQGSVFLVDSHHRWF